MKKYRMQMNAWSRAEIYLSSHHIQSTSVDAPPTVNFIAVQLVAARTRTLHINWARQELTLQLSQCYHSESVSVAAEESRCHLSSCPHHGSVFDVVLGVKSSSTADGSLIQGVTIRLAIVIVDREVLHVHRPLWLHWLKKYRANEQTQVLLCFV